MCMCLLSFPVDAGEENTRTDTLAFRFCRKCVFFRDFAEGNMFVILFCFGFIYIIQRKIMWRNSVFSCKCSEYSVSSIYQSIHLSIYRPSDLGMNRAFSTPLKLYLLPSTESQIQNYSRNHEEKMTKYKMKRKMKGKDKKGRKLVPKKEALRNPILSFGLIFTFLARIVEALLSPHITI